MGISIALEGPEGSGKTTQSRVLESLLRNYYKVPVRKEREPGSTPAGEAIRDILQNRDYSSHLEPTTNVLLYSAARSEMVNKVLLPWKKENSEGVFITDRCWISTEVLQGNDGATPKYIEAVSEPFINIWPDKIILLCLHPLESMVRLEVSKRLNMSRELNWRDLQPREVYEDIWNRYLTAANVHKDRMVLVDGFQGVSEISYDIVRLLNLEDRNYDEVKNDYYEVIKDLRPDFPEERARLELEVRKEFGYPLGSELRELMHKDLIEIGLEGRSGGIERK